MPSEAADKLEAALAQVEGLLTSTHAMHTALAAAESPADVRTLSARLERAEDALNGADNSLGVALAEYAESASEMALANTRVLLRPALSLAAALLHSGADSPKLATLLGLGDALDLEPQRDPASDISKLAERVRAAVAGLDSVFAEIVEARAKGRRSA